MSGGGGGRGEPFAMSDEVGLHGLFSCFGRRVSSDVCGAVCEGGPDGREQYMGTVGV